MALLIDLLGLFMLLVLGPFVLFGALVAEVASRLERVFHLPTLGMALSVAGLALITLEHSTPDANGAPFQGIATSLLDVISQGHILGIPVPYVFVLATCGLVALSMLIAVRSAVRA